ncbi:MAG: hypothetical protein J6M18_06630 [Actinomycetaceae bacterium]|nr:hypothetical protein [Actinomycetaceae bacterium]
MDMLKIVRLGIASLSLLIAMYVVSSATYIYGIYDVGGQSLTGTMQLFVLGVCMFLAGLLVLLFHDIESRLPFMVTVVILYAVSTLTFFSLYDSDVFKYQAFEYYILLFVIVLLFFFYYCLRLIGIWRSRIRLDEQKREARERDEHKRRQDDYKKRLRTPLPQWDDKSSAPPRF